MNEFISYGFLVVVLSLVCFPVTPLALTSIPLLGPVKGPFVVAVAVTIATLIAFALGRLGPGTLALLLRWFRFSEQNAATVEEAFTSESVWPFVVLRNLPHPLMVVSYAAGSVAGASFFRFSLITLLTLLLRGALMAAFGEAIVSEELTWQRILLLALSIVLLVFVFRHLRKSAINKLSPESTALTAPIHLIAEDQTKFDKDTSHSNDSPLLEK
ncbi:MAG: hypothetical protein ACPGVU_18200 [Limisphaerales bacterium]